MQSKALPSHHVLDMSASHSAHLSARLHLSARASLPPAPPPRRQVVILAAGVRHAIAVTSDGLCYSWGDGSLGRLGHGDQTMVSEPRVISTLKQASRK